MLTTFILAIWIGVESLGITPQQSYDYTGDNACEVFVLCGAGVGFTEYSNDYTDIGAFENLFQMDFGITAYSGMSLSLVNGQLQYHTGTAGTELLPSRTWSPLDPGHFLFLRGGDGFFYIAIEDLPMIPINGIASDFDYNDALFRVDPLTPVPEPGSLMLLGSGLALVARQARKRYRERNG